MGRKMSGHAGNVAYSSHTCFVAETATAVTCVAHSSSVVNRRSYRSGYQLLRGRQHGSTPARRSFLRTSPLALVDNESGDSSTHGEGASTAKTTSAGPDPVSAEEASDGQTIYGLVLFGMTMLIFVVGLAATISRSLLPGGLAPPAL
mmetsp:Transcript_13689/g.28072  ORF Transcript_13689/g.28072 Transcript_13689/m.28072 type:complete len:147 (-) Transcript_13689:2312-2752(-)